MIWIYVKSDIHHATIFACTSSERILDYLYNFGMIWFLEDSPGVFKSKDRILIIHALHVLQGNLESELFPLFVLILAPRALLLI